MTAKDSNCGDLYTLTAMNVESRLFISHHEGGRSIDDATKSLILCTANRRFARAIELFMDVDEKREKNSPIPVFILKNRRFLGSTTKSSGHPIIGMLMKMDWSMSMGN